MKRNVRVFVSSSPSNLEDDINEYVRVNQISIVAISYSTCYDTDDNEVVFSACILYESIK